MDLIKLFSGGFPLTIERLTFLQQTYTKALTQLTSFYGLNTNEIGVVKGLSVSTGTINTISDGIVIYNGEIMEFRGNSYDTGNFIIVEEVTQVPYNEDTNNDGDLDLKDSDVVRFMTTEDSGLIGESVTLNYPLNYLPTLQQIMPKIGEVKMWKGTAATVPSGWRIMTEMQDRFPMGVNGITAVGDVGGENEVVLKENQMPKHSHSGSTSSNGSHTHPFGIREDGFGTGSGASLTKDTSGNDEGFRFFNTSYAGSHTHSFSTNEKGSGASHENRPKFYSLYFIEFIGY